MAQARLLLPPLERQLDQQRNLLAYLTGRLPSRRRAGDIPARRRSACRARCRSACRPTSSASGPTCARPKPTCVPPTRRSASRSPTACRRSRSTANAGSSASDDRAAVHAADGVLDRSAGNAAQTMFDAGAPRAEAARGRSSDRAGRRAVSQRGPRRIPERRRRAARAAGRQRALIGAAIAAERSAIAQHRARAHADRSRAGRASPSCSRRSRPICRPRSRACRPQAARLADTVALFQALGGGWWNRRSRNPADRRAERDARRCQDAFRTGDLAMSVVRASILCAAGAATRRPHCRSAAALSLTLPRTCRGGRRPTARPSAASR